MRTRSTPKRIPCRPCRLSDGARNRSAPKDVYWSEVAREGALLLRTCVDDVGLLGEDSADQVRHVALGEKELQVLKSKVPTSDVGSATAERSKGCRSGP